MAAGRVASPQGERIVNGEGEGPAGEGQPAEQRLLRRVWCHPLSGSLLAALVVLLLLLTLWVMHNLEKSKPGRALHYLREDQLAAESIGISNDQRIRTQRRTAREAPPELRA